MGHERVAIDQSLGLGQVLHRNSKHQLVVEPVWRKKQQYEKELEQGEVTGNQRRKQTTDKPQAPWWDRQTNGIP